VACISPLNAAHNLGELGIFELAQVLVLAACVVLWVTRGTFTFSLNVLVATIMLLFVGREISWARVYGAGPSVVDTIMLAHTVLLIVTLAALQSYGCGVKNAKQSSFARIFGRAVRLGWR
jgi:hypothetical protein